MEKQRSIDTLPLDGGWLCLDFINTVHDRTAGDPFEYLAGYGDLIDWSVKVELLTSAEKKEFELIAGTNREQADLVLNYIIETRELLYKYFLAIAQARIPAGDLQVKFNALLSETLVKLELRVGEHMDVHQLWSDKHDLKYPLLPVIKSAYDLLTSGILNRVKECGSCGWLFLDQSKNKSRKWCSMESCGSNVKAKRYYHRKKKERS